MASTPTLPTQAARPASPPAQAARPASEATAENGNAAVSAHALIAAPAAGPDEAEPAMATGPVAQLPVELDVAVPIRNFRVRDLLALEPGQVVGSEWGHGEDVPLGSSVVQLAWSEFEVVDTQLAVRITRLH